MTTDSARSGLLPSRGQSADKKFSFAYTPPATPGVTMVPQVETIVPISAEEIGTPKPQPEIFLAALRLTKVDSKDFVYVGDDMVNDIDGAKNVGMTTIWKKNSASQLNGNTVPDKVIEHIGALPRAIQEIVNDRPFR